MNRRIRELHIIAFFLTVVILLAGIFLQETALADDPITISISAGQASVKPGKSLEFSYSVTASGTIASIEYKAYGTITNNEGYVWILGKGSLTSASGKVTVNSAKGEDIFIVITAIDTDGNRKEQESEHIPVANVKLGKRGWVKTANGTYYGDENGYAMTGLQYLNSKYYFFNEDGLLQTGWLKMDSGTWYYAGPDGAFIDNVRGMSEITIPGKVDQLETSFFAYADRTFMIRCEKGSYAESFARKYGFQYSNGEKTVRGCDITDVNQKADWIVSNYITSGMSQKEKARVLHNWLIFNAYYDLTYSNYEANGVLIKGKGVCDSYAKAYSLLLSKVGIENKRITGQTSDSGHAWNLVRIDGQWYHVDCTWDDPIGGPETAVSGIEGQGYFLVNDAYVKNSRSFDEDISADANHVNFIYLGDATFYYGTDGKRATGWTEISESGFPAWYYFDKDGYMQKGWLELDGDWYWLGENGIMATGKQVIDGKAYNFGSDGKMRQVEWAQRGGRWYAYDADGNAIFGWLQIGKDWYYIADSGMVTGWSNIGGIWYYMNGTGEMQTGWIGSGGSYYLLDASGGMHIGWAEDGGAWYYMNTDGIMQTGWQKIGNTWYYFSGSGAMVTGWQGIGGAWYFFADSGSMKTGWVEDGNTWYWLDNNGSMATGWQQIDGRWEMFADSGAWQYTWDGN